MREMVCLLVLGAGWLLGSGLNRLAVWIERQDGADRLAACVRKQAASQPGGRVLGGAPIQPPARWREIALQAAAATLTAVLWLQYGFSKAFVSAALITLLLLLIAAIDVDRGLVLNELIVLGCVLALLHAALAGHQVLLASLAGGGLAFGLFLLLALLQRGALGAGDVKLAGLLGLIFGYPVAVRALFLAVVFGGVVAGLLLVTRVLDRKAAIPYAPFLAAGGILVLLVQ